MTEFKDRNKLSSMHPSQLEKMVFVRYSPPPSSTHNRADYDVWFERINYLCEDLHWLLQLPHEKFWCHVVYDEGLQKMLDSFLHHCPRTHDDSIDMLESGKTKHLELCRLVFMTYLRMSTHKESKDNFFAPSVFGDLLYDHFLFDIPKILDICSLFGNSNRAILSKMISNIFTQQPKYLDDLRQTLPTICEVFSNIASKCGILLSIPSSPQKLEKSVKKGGLLSMSANELKDIILYLSDTAVTLHRFLDIYPPAAKVFHEFQFCTTIANFYESMIPEVISAVKQCSTLSTDDSKHILLKLQRAKRSLLSVFHLIIDHLCLQPLLENKNEEISTACVEEFIHIMTANLTERRFLAAYDSMYSFKDDVDLIQQASSNVEIVQFEYIQSAIDSAFATFGRRRSPRGDTNTGGRTSPDGAVDSPQDQVATSTNSNIHQFSSTTMNPSIQPLGATSHPRPGDIEVESLISAVKDLFPNLGEGFIELALEEVGWDQEAVINCVLESNFPPALTDLPLDMPRGSHNLNQGDGQADEESLLDSRRNVFDNDEFDVFRSKDVDMNKIHIGKKEQHVDLEDKSVIDSARATYDLYGSVNMESVYDNPAMYEDEYDDTYDTNNVGADDADSADELVSHKVLPRVLQDLERKKLGKDKEVLSEENSEDENDSQKKRDEFVQDPAKLREQAERRRQAQGNRGRGYKSRDVKGAPKGQGQSSDVQHNRKVKEQFKGQRNRNLAAKKMSKGMF